MIGQPSASGLHLFVTRPAAELKAFAAELSLASGEVVHLHFFPKFRWDHHYHLEVEWIGPAPRCPAPARGVIRHGYLQKTVEEIPHFGPELSFRSYATAGYGDYSSSVYGHPALAHAGAAPLDPFRDEPPIELGGAKRRRAHGKERPKVAICLASRGLVFSRAIESIVREASSIASTHRVALFMSHGEGIPAAQSGIVTRAMRWGCSHVWLVEEDNYMPPGVLSAMLDQQAPITCCDYFNHFGSGWVLHEPLGPMQVYAFGCTLVRRDVLEAIGEPYVFNGHPLHLDARGEPYEDSGQPWAYGGQDMNFSLRAYRLGFRGTRLDGTRWRSPHLHVAVSGNHRNSNNDGHRVVAH